MVKHMEGTRYADRKVSDEGKSLFTSKTCREFFALLLVRVDGPGGKRRAGKAESKGRQRDRERKAGEGIAAADAGGRRIMV